MPCPSDCGNEFEPQYWFSQYDKFVAAYNESVKQYGYVEFIVKNAHRTDDPANDNSMLEIRLPKQMTLGNYLVVRLSELPLNLQMKADKWLYDFGYSTEKEDPRVIIDNNYFIEGVEL